MKNMQFSIYTDATGHAVLSFPAFDELGNSCFDQAIAFALKKHTDQNDKPLVYILSEVPINLTTTKTSA